MHKFTNHANRKSNISVIVRQNNHSQLGIGISLPMDNLNLPPIYDFVPLPGYHRPSSKALQFFYVIKDIFTVGVLKYLAWTLLLQYVENYLELQGPLI